MDWYFFPTRDLPDSGGGDWLFRPGAAAALPNTNERPFDLCCPISFSRANTKLGLITIGLCSAAQLLKIQTHQLFPAS